MEISAYELGVIITDAAEAGAIRALAKAGVIKPTMRKEEACRQYGRAKVERWIKQGKLKKGKDDKWDIDKTHIESLNRDLSPIYKTIRAKNQ